MNRRASEGIILSSVVSKYQLGLVFHAGSLIVPVSAATPHGTCESAMNSAFSALTSPAKEAGNLARSSRSSRPGAAGSGGRRAGRGSLISVATNSPGPGQRRRRRRAARPWIVAGFGYHRAAVRVADQNHRTVLLGDHPLGRRDIIGQRCGGILHDGDRVPVLL